MVKHEFFCNKSKFNSTTCGQKEREFDMRFITHKYTESPKQGRGKELFILP